MSAFLNNVEQRQIWRHVRDGAQSVWSKGRDRVLRFGEARFWVSKWVVAAAIFVVILLAGIYLLATSNIDFDTFLNYFALGLLNFCAHHALLRHHRHPRRAIRNREASQSPASGCHPRGWLGEPLHAPRTLAVLMDLGDALPPRSRLGHERCVGNANRRSGPI